MAAQLGVLSLLLLLPGVIVVLLRHIDDAEDIERREMQKLIGDALKG